MQTLKTAVVVVLLLVVFYGVYEMLNRPPDPPPPEVAQMEDLSLDAPDVQFGQSASAPATEPTISVPPVTTNGPVESPVPPYTMVPPANSQYGSSSYPAAGPPSPPQPPREPESPLMVEPPSPPVTDVAANPNLANPPGGAILPPPAAPQNSPLPSAAKMTPPGVQNNPYVDEPLGVRPSGMADSAGSGQTGVRAFERARKMARSMIDEGKYRDALATLSVFYRSPDLTPAEHRELIDLLDPLAGRVVYSREHLMEAPYIVRRNETLTDVAQRCNVPMELLQKINGIDTPNVLVPGSQLKIVTGPFRAEVDLPAQELTVFLGELYAGRFPITVGQDPAPIAGDFKIREKREDRDYFSMEGRKIPAGNPANPFGSVWLDLGREVCIHGSPTGGADPQRGCISLSPKDADDVYGILSVGSAVRILR